MAKALIVANIHRNLRAARYTAGHCEGLTSDWVDIRDGEKSITMDYDDFIALADAIRNMELGPRISVVDGRADF